jgi:hypothetical protein
MKRILLAFQWLAMHRMNIITSQNVIHKNPLNPHKSLKSEFSTHASFTNGHGLDTDT